MLLVTTTAVPPPGSCQTATAIRTRIAKLRTWVARSGPTHGTIAARRGRDDYASDGAGADSGAAGISAAPTGAPTSAPSAASAANRYPIPKCVWM